MSKLALIPTSMPDVFRLADSLAQSRGFVPSTYLGQPHAIAACILTGAELGMGPMESLREIHVVNGRPTLSSGAMLARAIRAGVRVEWLESTDSVATLRLTRDDVQHEETWTIEGARKAGLAGKSGPWQTYPKAMLRARCISAAVRAFAPDVIGGGGLYVPEEAESIDVQVVPDDDDEQRVASLLRGATSLVEIASAKAELVAARQRRTVGDAAFARLVDLGREAAQRVANAAVIAAEGSV